MEKNIALSGLAAEAHDKWRPGYANIIYRLRILMMSDMAIAAEIDVTEAVLKFWVEHLPEAKEAYSGGGVWADAQVMLALKRKATGEKVEIDGKEIYYPPDTRAAELWLRERQKMKFGNTPTAYEVAEQEKEKRESEAYLKFMSDPEIMQMIKGEGENK